MSGKFFESFPKISWNFSTFLKSKKNIIFYPKQSKITIFIKIRPNFSLNPQNIAIFPLETLLFQNFRRLRSRKFGVLCPKNPEFFGVGGHTWGGVLSPKKTISW